MSHARSIARAGVIAAAYAALTLLALQLPWQLGWGPVQLRVSEAATVLALFTPAAIPGLALGTAVANLFNVSQIGPVALLDVVFGALGTLLGAVWTWRFRERMGIALMGPVIANALIVPAYLPFMLAAAGLPGLPLLGIPAGAAWPVLYLAGVVTVGLGEAVVMYAIGWPLALGLRAVGIERVLRG